MIDKASLVTEAQAQFTESTTLKQGMLADLEPLADMAFDIAESIRQGGKLLLCGNGGSAADAQHLAAELLVRLRSECNRQSIPAIALALDTSTITACANDYGFEHLYERMVEGLAKPGDVLLGISTSGRSKNVLLAFDAARKRSVKTFGFLGKGGPALEYCDRAFLVPSDKTNRIQEVHILAGHILMEFVERLLMA